MQIICIAEEYLVTGVNLTAFMTVVCSKQVGLKYKGDTFPLSKGIDLSL